MSYFSEALAATLKHEGGYANDPLDRGGETYRGISRKYHPGWPGWARIDALDRTSRRHVDEDPALRGLIEAFYRREFWEPIGGDALEDRGLACALFDCAVNLGCSKAVWFLQRALNALSKNGSLTGIVGLDRRWGPETARALKAQLAAKGAGPMCKCIEAMRISHYLNLIEHDSTQSRFAYGWLARVGRAA